MAALRPNPEHLKKSDSKNKKRKVSQITDGHASKETFGPNKSRKLDQFFKKLSLIHI